MLAELTRQRDRMQSTVLRLRADLEHAEQTRRRESQQSRSELGALLGDVGQPEAQAQAYAYAYA